MRSITLEKSKKSNIQIFESILEQYFPEPSDKEGLLENPQFKILMSQLPGTLAVVDFTDKSYHYFSDSVKDVLGYEPEHYYKNGFAFTITQFPPEHQKVMLEHILPMAFERFSGYAEIGESKNVRISYTTLLSNKDGKYKWFLHQLSVLETDEQGKIRLGLKLLTDISEFKKDNQINFVISKKDQNGIYQNVFSTAFLTEDSSPLISGRELEILQLISTGKSSKNIADSLCISEHTVSTHRKNMLKKTGCQTSHELVRYAIANGLMA
jgi:DNA-binding CsgD family transcriptional regulator